MYILCTNVHSTMHGNMFVTMLDRCVASSSDTRKVTKQYIKLNGLRRASHSKLEGEGIIYTSLCTFCCKTALSKPARIGFLIAA